METDSTQAGVSPDKISGGGCVCANNRILGGVLRAGTSLEISHSFREWRSAPINSDGEKVFHLIWSDRTSKNLGGTGSLPTHAEEDRRSG
jgi:hypothetical protein